MTATQRVSPGQKWITAEHGVLYIVNEVYDNLGGGREDYATMFESDGKTHAFTTPLWLLRRDYRLVEDVPVDSPRNPAEQTAADRGLPVVLVTPNEAVQIAQGRSLVVATKDGGEILVRLFRPDEFRAAHQAAVARVFDGTGIPKEHIPAPPSDEQIERLVRPLRQP